MDLKTKFIEEKCVKNIAGEPIIACASADWIWSFFEPYISIPLDEPVKPESENKKEYLIADLMENIRHSFDGADIVIKFSITAKCKHSKRTISNQ